MTESLVKQVGREMRVYPLDPSRPIFVSTPLGFIGRVVYATTSRLLGVRLDGESKIRRYPSEACRSVL